MIHLTFHDCTSYFGCLSSQSPLWEDRGKMILVKRLEADFRSMSNKVKKKKMLWRALCFRDLVCSIQNTSLLYPVCIFFPFLSNKKKIKVLAFGRRNEQIIPPKTTTASRYRMVWHLLSKHFLKLQSTITFILLWNPLFSV